ncbi:uncharacterized protein [Anabrus simplex]|uniref:uncharacterized protein n=1 Tax=Anabrus simplex TaxID=316456 RepID=UPI0035A35DFF
MQETVTDSSGSTPPGKHFRERTLRTLKLSLGKLWKRRSVTITEYDPTYKVAYLGNVLTGWAKGEGCVEKPLSTLWKNYTGSCKPDVPMKLTVSQAGLKAVTKEHGLTEYWSHRITYCAAPNSFPRVFCWVYRHEGRKLKQELRCHAVLCPKEAVARRMASQLRAKLAQALSEFKRDKVCRQNARLSLANSVYDNPSLPRRKILLSTGSHNYRPPLERSKSAPKLMVIEESVEEEVEEEPQPETHSRRFPSSRILHRLSSTIVDDLPEEDEEEEAEEEDEIEEPEGEEEREEEDADEEQAEERDQRGYEEVLRLRGNTGESSEKDQTVDILHRFSEKDSEKSYREIVSIIDEHRESMNDEHKVALGERNSCCRSDRIQQQKGVSWNFDKPCCKSFHTERLLIIGNKVRDSVSDDDDQVFLERESESDEGTNSLQSISSSGSSDTSSTITSGQTLISEEDYGSLRDSSKDKISRLIKRFEGSISESKDYASLPYIYSEECGEVDWRPGAAGTVPTRRVDLDGLSVTLRRSATFPPPTVLTVETLELDSLSEEDDVVEESTEAGDEDNVSDESGYAELIDLTSAKDECLKAPHSAVPTTRCVQV